MPKFDDSKHSWMDYHDDNLTGIMPNPKNPKSRTLFKKMHIDSIEKYIFDTRLNPDEELRPQIDNFFFDVCNADVSDPTARERQFIQEILNKFHRVLQLLTQTGRYRPGFLLSPNRTGITDAPTLTWEPRNPDQVAQDRLVSAFLIYQSFYTLSPTIPHSEAQKALMEIVVDTFALGGHPNERKTGPLVGGRVRNPWILTPLQLLKREACMWYLAEVELREWIDFIPRFDMEYLNKKEDMEEAVLGLVEEEVERWIPSEEEERQKRERKCGTVVAALGGTWGVGAVGELIREIEKSGI